MKGSSTLTSIDSLSTPLGDNTTAHIDGQSRDELPKKPICLQKSHRIMVTERNA